MANKQVMKGSDVTKALHDFTSPQQVYYAMRIRSELKKLIGDKVVFTLYNPEQTYLRIQEEINMLVSFVSSFKLRRTEPDASMTRNYIIGIPP